MSPDLPSAPPGPTKITNRVRAYLIHIPFYSIEGPARLAQDCGVYRSTIGRLARNEISPSYALARRVTDALSRRMGVELDIREVFSSDNTYPTAKVCDVTPNCNGCFPPEAYTADDVLKPEYRDQRPGDWCTYPSSPPRGLPSQSITSRSRASSRLSLNRT